jgi:hypothetical protein
MKCHETYAQLELIPIKEIQKIPAVGRSQHSQTRFRKAATVFQNIAREVISFLSGSLDPRIEHYYDAAQNLHYRVYDPRARQTLHFQDEAEIRIWLEQRYYQ